MLRSRLLSVGLAALAAVVLAAGPAPAQHPPATGNTKMWPWNVGTGYVGYNEPVTRPTAPEPGVPPQPPRKYQLWTYTLPQKTTGEDANSVELVAHLPEDAVIWFEGQQMPRKETMMRDFVSPPLTPGVNYVYDIRVNWAEDDRRAEQALKVRVQAGDTLCLDLRPVHNKDVQAEIKASLDKLTPEDRKGAERQGFCAVQESNPLGSMGTPVKVTLKGQPVFLCCPGCVDKARTNPDQTLARVKDLQARKVGSDKP
jgi:uncharacterized protein (TIGR03000 family)